METLYYNIRHVSEYVIEVEPIGNSNIERLGIDGASVELDLSNYSAWVLHPANPRSIGDRSIPLSTGIFKLHNFELIRSTIRTDFRRLVNEFDTRKDKRVKSIDLSGIFDYIYLHTELPVSPIYTVVRYLIRSLGSEAVLDERGFSGNRYYPFRSLKEKRGAREGIKASSLHRAYFNSILNSLLSELEIRDFLAMKPKRDNIKNFKNSFKKVVDIYRYSIPKKN